MEPDPLLPDRGEPLGLHARDLESPEAYPDVRARHFEFSSRGDRVPGRLWLPPRGEGPFPLVLLQHGRGGCKDAPYLDATAGPWARGGAAVASIDLPLHGARADTKLAERLAAALRRPGDGEGCSVLVEFTRQSVADLQRALDATALMAEIDSERVAYAAFSLGSIVGATFCGVDPRPRAAALALGGGGFGPPAIDPTRFIGHFAPRPLLFVNATRDEIVSRAASEALFAAAREPKEMLWFEAGHGELPGRALKAMWLFLQRHLLVGDAARAASTAPPGG